MPGWSTNGAPLFTPAQYLTGMAPQTPVDTLAPAGAYPESVALSTGAVGLGAFNTYTAAGTTQGGATLLTSFKNIITVATTASTHGVRLPVAVTGMSIVVGNNAAFGVKVYPATNGQIAAASTNAADATVLAINKVNTYFAVSATKWIVYRGA